MSEGFLRRWSRLKRASIAEPPSRAGAATVPAAAPAAAPAELPAIEGIGAGGNVSAFLQPGVPDDLARAALRTAWVSDPAIRDFVGIAENQWDFNAEGAIAGFGSLTAEESARHMAARALSARSFSAPELSAENATVAPQVSSDDRRESSDVAARLDSAGAARPSAAPAATPPSEPTAEPTEPEPQLLPETPVPGRTHGSALPR